MYFLEVLCALAVALLFADVEAGIVHISKNIGSTSITGSQILLYEVKCDYSACDIKDFWLQGISGNLEMEAFSKSTKICSTNNNVGTCSGKQIREKVFYIILKPNSSFINGKISVILYVVASIKLINPKSASVQQVLTKNFAFINSGKQAVTFPSLLKQYVITCNGNCNNLIITGIGDNFVLAASKDPILVKDEGCYNCFCAKEGSSSVKICNSGNIGWDRFYFTMIPDYTVKDVYSYIKGGNFKSIAAYNDIKGNFIGPFKSSDRNKPARVYRINGPIRSELTLDLDVKFDPDFNHRRFHIDVMSDATVKEVLATKVVYAFFNKSYTTTCNDRNACKSFDMDIEKGKSYGRPSYFRTRVVLGTSSKHYPAYVRVSGDKIQDLEEIYVPR